MLEKGRLKCGRPQGVSRQPASEFAWPGNQGDDQTDYRRSHPVAITAAREGYIVVTGASMNDGLLS
jgi:hypothetical protein